MDRNLAAELAVAAGAFATIATSGKEVHVWSVVGSAETDELPPGASAHFTATMSPAVVARDLYEADEYSSAVCGAAVGPSGGVTADLTVVPDTGPPRSARSSSLCVPVDLSPCVERECIIGFTVSVSRPEGPTGAIEGTAMVRGEYAGRDAPPDATITVVVDG